jgi:hypothetical protein
MSKENFNPNDVVSRALLLMKYDSNKTLTENQDTIKLPLIKEQVGGGAAAGTGVAGAALASGAVTGMASGAGAGAGALGAVTTWSGLGAALANPVGISALVITGAFLYGIYRNADNEEKLRDTYKACKVMKSKGYYDELNRNMALKPSEVKQAALLYYQSKKGEFDPFGQGWGSNEDSMRKANAILKKGNLADICIVMLKYQGKDFADEMAEEFDEFDLAELVDAFDSAVDEYAGGGNKIVPEDSYNINWYKENFGCVFRSTGVWAKEHGVKITDDGYTYIIIKGLKRKTNTGKDYQKLYRLYGDEGRLTTVKDKSGNVFDTNATLKCQGPANPVAIIQGSEEGLDESLYETYLRKNPINEVFDDRNIKVVKGDVLDDTLSGWEEGKKVAPWKEWLVKYPCLKQKFPSASALTDNMGYTYFINLNGLNKKNYRFYSDGEIWDADGAKFIGKKWSCSLRGDTVLVESRKRMMEQIDFPIEGETDVVPVNPVNPVNPTEPIYKPCSSFPMGNGCQSSKISEVQKCINTKSDGKLGPKTITMLKSKGYGDTITQEVYDKIKSTCKTNNNLPNVDPNKLPNVDPNKLPNDDPKIQDELIANNDPSIG